MARWRVELDVELNIVGGFIIVEADSAADAEQMVSDGKIDLNAVDHKAQSTDPGVQSVYPTGETDEED